MGLGVGLVGAGSEPFGGSEWASVGYKLLTDSFYYTVPTGLVGFLWSFVFESSIVRVLDSLKRVSYNEYCMLQ